MRFLILSALILLITGCSQNVDGTWKAPFVYRIDIQQGNVVDQDMINKLKPGMSREQVRFIMGTPLLTDPFHSNRWDYIYSFEPGGGERQQRKVTLYFKDDILAYVDGDIQVTYNPVITDEATKERSVVVPLEEHEEGFFSKLWGDDEPEDKAESEEEEPSEEITTVEPTDDAIPEETVSDTEQQTTEDESTAGDTEKQYGISKTVSDEDTVAAKPVEKKDERNLFRRFWERITADEREESKSGEETEQDRRDAEIFKEAGGSY